ncbi:hypothetical protein ZWY2020_014748 [Hordeum vulgare]|nr:hypothetical protein ZWY2020_014748 [Hordeum vulgare]
MLPSPPSPSATSVASAPRQVSTAPLPPPPFRPVRLAPGAPWFFSEEQRLRLRSSALVVAPDLSQPTHSAPATDLAAAIGTGSPSATCRLSLAEDPGRGDDGAASCTAHSGKVAQQSGYTHDELLTGEPEALAIVAVPVGGPSLPADVDTFIDSVSSCGVEPLLPTSAPCKAKAAAVGAVTSRSARLDKKKKKVSLLPGAGSEAVQEIIARLCGVLDPSVGYNAKAKQAYLDLFAMPLAAPVVQAIVGLVSHAKNLSQKKLKKGKVATVEAQVTNV